jgi:hypothetical protein
VPTGTVGRPFEVGGWAIDQGAASDTGIDAVHVYAFPSAGGAPIFLGASPLGFARPDVAAVYGPQFANAGWLMTVDSLAAGPYVLVVGAHSALTGAFDVIQTRPITVVVNSQPILTIDAPSEGATSTSPLYIGGWAIDLGASVGTGIDAVHVYAYPDPGSGAAPIFLGVADYGVTRSDVGAIFGARFTPSGWELRSPLSPGTYLLAMAAHSAVTNSFTAVQTRMVTIQ